MIEVSVLLGVVAGTIGIMLIVGCVFMFILRRRQRNQDHFKMSQQADKDIEKASRLHIKSQKHQSQNGTTSENVTTERKAPTHTFFMPTIELPQNSSTHQVAAYRPPGL